MTKSIYTQIASSKDFIKQYKKANVRIRKSFDNQFKIFAEYPMELKLHNHPLRDNWKGCRSINITADWRAVYKEIEIGGETLAYFVALGTHKELYK